MFKVLKMADVVYNTYIKVIQEAKSIQYFLADLFMS